MSKKGCHITGQITWKEKMSRGESVGLDGLWIGRRFEFVVAVMSRLKAVEIRPLGQRIFHRVFFCTFRFFPINTTLQTSRFSNDAFVSHSFLLVYWSKNQNNTVPCLKIVCSVVFKVVHSSCSCCPSARAVLHLLLSFTNFGDKYKILIGWLLR